MLLLVFLQTSQEDLSAPLQLPEMQLVILVLSQLLLTMQNQDLMAAQLFILAHAQRMVCNGELVEILICDFLDVIHL
jgi:hypothetical protein